MTTSLFDQITSAASSSPKPTTLGAALTAQKRAALAVAHAQHTAKAVARYKVAMQGAGWLKTSLIEARLGFAKTVANPFLKKLLNDLKLIERRNRDDDKVFNKKKGWEWRWKEMEK